jgi:amino-acid N-acetyltransferase
MERGRSKMGGLFLILNMQSLKKYKLADANAGLRSAVISLLKENNLPVADLDEKKNLFAFLENGKVIGSGGLEFFNRSALLRSISIKKELQGMGAGKLLLRKLETIARRNDVSFLYLLTTTAKEFFSKEGYEIIQRDAVPEEIKNTTEFSSVCPTSATVMRKNLS